MITSALESKNRSPTNHLSGSKLAGKDKQNTNSQIAIANMKPTCKEFVIDSVNKLAERIESVGICDNKKVKPPK